MIDDLVPAAVSLDGKLGPHNDWGFLLDGPDSLFTFFRENLLKNYPEIKGTVFLPLESQRSIPTGPGYVVFRKDIDDEFVKFTKKFSAMFELAFHGIRHTFLEAGQWIFEFADPGGEDLALAEEKITAAAALGIRFNGGKFPGYKGNEKAIDFVRQENFKWLAFSACMINKKHPCNELDFVNKTGMVNIPTNMSGDVFNEKATKGSSSKRVFKYLLSTGSHFKPEKHLEFLYIHGHPITIQEHFQNQRPDGKRQTPNIYDDIHSLDRIFAWLRPRDIWYATCSDIAHYFDSYMNTEVVEKNNDEFEIRYQGNWEKMYLSFAADCPSVQESPAGSKYSGIEKNGRFVFNCLPAGTYRSCQ